jgi:choline dehydrogenase-like flavoprotein
VCHFSTDEGGRLTKVHARSHSDKRISVSAERFIFAAGTLETTRLLLLLDRSTGQRAFAACDAVGRYFHDHLAVEVGKVQPIDAQRTNRVFGYYIGGLTRRSLHLETTPQAQRDDGAASGFVTVRPEFRQRSVHNYIRNLGRSAQAGRFLDLLPDKLLARDAATLVPALYWKMFHKQMYFSGQVDLFVDARIEQVPSVNSRINLSSQKDPFDVPMLQLVWRKTPIDALTFRAVLKRARSFWKSTFLQKSSPVEWAFDPSHDDHSLIEASRDTRHPAGTARMGTDPANSVVDPSLRCHSVPNLFVASAAVFPSSGSANPTLTVMQLAMLAAEGALK